jgi:hypothetical protein
VHDVGVLGRLVMAAEGRWIHEGALHQDLGDKLAECLWWLFVLSELLGVDLNTAFSSKISKLEKDLSSSLESAVRMRFREHQTSAPPRLCPTAADDLSEKCLTPDGCFCFETPRRSRENR